jgi:enediyne biosynthesis protein E4
VLSNGHMPAAEFIKNDIDNPNRLFYNNGDGTFTDIAAASGIDHPGVCRGLAYSDYDQDGDLDLLFANIQSYYTAEVDKVLLYRNELNNPNAHWLGVKLVGVVANPDAFGAKVRIELDGASWVDEVSGGCSHASQNSSILHFGLGSQTNVNRLTVYWPGGREQVLEDIPADQILTIVEDTTGYNQPSGLPGLELGLGLRVRPNPVVQDARISLELPSPVSASRVSVLDPSGRSVALLHSGSLASGTTTLYWNGADAAGQRLSPGTYLVEVLLDNGVRRTERVVVVR